MTEVREEMAEYFRPLLEKATPGCTLPGVSCPGYAYKAQDGIVSCKYCLADQLLSLKYPNGEPMLYVGAEDQSLPENPHKKTWSITSGADYLAGQESMSDFRRIVKE